MPFSMDVLVMAAPSRAFAASLEGTSGGLWSVASRPALAALVMGTASAFAATGHVTLGLLVSGLVCWTFVPLLQMATAAAITWPRAARSLPLARRLELWFMGHAPWSLWIFTVTLLMGNAGIWSRLEWAVIATAVIPSIWTSVIAAAFCRVVLGDSPRAAIARTAVHQAITWTLLLLYFGWAVALQPRIAAFLGG
jgi:hypothetical protein